MSMRKIVLLGLVVLMFVVAYFWWRNGNAPVNTRDESEKVFVVERGSGVRAIANDLKEQGLIRDPIAFFILTKKEGSDTKIQAGDYKLSPSMNLSQILDELTHGTIDVWVTIPEGMRSEEVADILEKQIPSYQDSWRQVLIDNEGYLFPDTYLIPKETDISTVLSIFKSNFDKKIANAGLTDNPNLENAVIIASLIEREAITDDEKPMIASVIANRLRQGMALDIDATLQYAKGKVGDKWWTVPTAADKNINSPYNTYRNPGLPPGPIGNPGIEAIKAAVNPATSSYFFYIHDSSGKAHFAKTLEEHNANIAKYL